MNIQFSQSEVGLSKRQTLSLSDGAGVRIEARAGVVWVTQDNDRRDMVLHKGEAVTLERDGRVVVQAFEPSRICLEQTAAPIGHEAEGWLARVAGALRRWGSPQPSLA